MPALENVTLWHERDISHSSTERYIAPDATGTLDFALDRMAGIVEQLVFAVITSVTVHQTTNTGA
jgi:adenylosuccinate lyase